MTLKIDISDIGMDAATQILEAVRKIELSATAKITFSYGEEKPAVNFRGEESTFSRYMNSTKKE